MKAHVFEFEMESSNRSSRKAQIVARTFGAAVTDMSKLLRETEEIILGARIGTMYISNDIHAGKSG